MADLFGDPGNEDVLRSGTIGGNGHVQLLIPACAIDDITRISVGVLFSDVMDKSDRFVASQTIHADHLNSLLSQPVWAR